MTRGGLGFVAGGWGGRGGAARVYRAGTLGRWRSDSFTFSTGYS